MSSNEKQGGVDKSSLPRRAGGRDMRLPLGTRKEEDAEVVRSGTMSSFHFLGNLPLRSLP